MSRNNSIKKSRRRLYLMNYRRQHPTISINLTKKLKSIIDEVKGNKSYTRFIHDFLTDEKGVLMDALKKGYVIGYTDCKKELMEEQEQLNEQ